MISLISKIKNIFFKKEFFLFVFVGVVNTGNSIVFAYLLSNILNDNLAYIVGYVISLAVSYLLNSFITFREKLSFSKLFKFCISYIPNFIIQNLAVIIFLNMLGWHKLIAYMIAAVIGIPVTFILQRFFTFKKN
jgi:putative flippase GtrA